MARVSFILRTKRGASALAFDTIEAARNAKATHEKRVGIPFQIVRQTITEETVA